MEQNITVHKYSSPHPGSVNTYWIETPHSLIAIDFQRVLSQARAALQQVEAIGKPVATLFITHPHPDHFAGTEVFAAAYPDAKIYASQNTLEKIRDDLEGWMQVGKQLLGDDFPEKATLPGVVLRDAGIIEIDGLELQTKELGAAESSSATAIYLPATKSLFSGDIVLNGMHGFFLEEQSGKWLDVLRSLKEQFPDAETIYPGHGEPGVFDELLARQVEYIEAFRKAVSERIEQDGGWTAEDKKRVAELTEKRYPGWQRPAAQPDLLELNAEAVAKEISKEKS